MTVAQKTFFWLRSDTPYPISNASDVKSFNSKSSLRLNCVDLGASFDSLRSPRSTLHPRSWPLRSLYVRMEFLPHVTTWSSSKGENLTQLAW